jgi:hypothetical protein
MAQIADLTVGPDPVIHTDEYTLGNGSSVDCYAADTYLAGTVVISFNGDSECKVAVGFDGTAPTAPTITTTADATGISFAAIDGSTIILRATGRQKISHIKIFNDSGTPDTKVTYLR